MAQGGRDPDLPYIPDCIELEDDVSAAFDLHDMRQGLPGTLPERPERQRRRHRAGRQARETRERHQREREERRSRRAAARTIPPSDEDLRLPAPAGQASSTTPQRKVARVAPFVREPRRPLGRAGRGAMILQLLKPSLRPPPLLWNHGDGRPLEILASRTSP